MDKLPLNQLVKTAQSGDEAAITELLYRFGWRPKGRWQSFLGKYDKLLWHGRVDLKNKETRRFLQLYTKNKEVRRQLMFKYQNYQTVKKTISLVNYLQDVIHHHYTRQDLRQLLLIEFLELVQRYEKIPSVSFSGYLMGSYKYRIFNRLDKEVFNYDMFWYQDRFTQDVIPYQEPGYAPEWLEKDPLLDLEEASGELGLFWVNGHCSPLFKPLSRIERSILREWYLLKRTDTHIAKHLGYHRNTILHKRHQAVAKLAAILKERHSS